MKKFHILLVVVLIAAVILLLPIQIPYEGEMTTIQEGKELFRNLSESYPEHPRTLKDCENTSRVDFCLSDVAEINSDSGICEMIRDPGIKIFCMAKVLLNETLCYEIGEEGLEGSCLESIAMKRRWSNIE